MNKVKVKALANYLHINESQIREDIGSIFYGNPETDFEDVYYVLTEEQVNHFKNAYGLESSKDLANYDHKENVVTVGNHRLYIYRRD